MEGKCRIQIYNTEEEKNKQISILMDKHVAAFSEMRNHYNNVMQESVSSVETLKVLFLRLKVPFEIFVSFLSISYNL